MNDIAIRCEGLGKKYRIGERESYKALRDTITDAVSAPFRRLRKSKNSNPAISNAEFWALKDISFEVKRGEVVGIIGRNGAGKSTLLKILSRITAPTTGEVEIRGRVGSLLEVGTGFHPELTGRENIFLNGTILGMKKQEIKHNFDEIVAFAEIEKFLDTPVKRYSSGMYVRLAFAVAAHLESEILIVDEVLAVGDIAFQKKCLGKMSDVARDGRTILFVSHNMGAIQRLCRECMLFDAGRKLNQGLSAVILPEYFSMSNKYNESNSVDLTDKDYDLRIRVLDESGNQTKIWRFGQRLTIEVDVFTAVPLCRPAVDISIHSDEQTRLFALQSDKLGDTPEIIMESWNVKFIIDNPRLTASEMYIDIGLRERNDPYIVLLREAERIFADHTSTPEAALTDCILYPEARQTWKGR
jgi:lipopolysaccharide transport system ATP-binding protein